jgi:hypothetical protein
MADNKTRRRLVEAAKRAMQQQGFKLEKLPGRGLSNVWRVEKDGKVQKACIRTTQDRWYAFPPLENGTKWKTLDDVDSVIVSAVDAKNGPKAAQVYLFPAPEVRKRFDAAYQARTENGDRVQRDKYGMWVNLDIDERGIASSVGSGMANDYPQIATFPLWSLPEGQDEDVDLPEVGSEGQTVKSFDSIADVIAFARSHIARIAGVNEDAVKLDLKIGY